MDAVKPRTLPPSERGLNLEMVMWTFTRLSVLAMYGFILAGILGGLLVSAQTQTSLAEVLRWAFLPNLADNPLAGTPWISALAKLMVIAFIAVVSGHGVHGILEILDDYFAGPPARRWFRNGVIAYALLVNVIAIYVIWTA